MIERFAEELYKSIVEENMELYKKFFLCDPNEEGTIDYWKKAIGFFNTLDDKEKEILFSIMRNTITDTISNVLAVFDGSTGADDISVQVKLNDYKNDGELQDAFLAYAEEAEE